MDICDVCDCGMLSADAEYYPCGHCIEGNSFSISEHDKTIRAEEREKTIDECKEVVKRQWLNGTVAHRITEEICNSLEQLKGAEE